MKGKVVLITGATSGIGFHTARALTLMGARVLLTGRNEARGRAAVDRLRLEAGHDRVAFLSVDHSSVGGNRDLAERVLERADHLNVLVNNVGAIHARRRETADGYEATLATNFLAPFALTDLLMPLLLESSPTRVVNVVSSAYSMWKRDPLEDLAAKERYVGIEAYAHSKLLNVLWTLALARRLEGSGVVANAANPGMAWTNQTRAMTPQTVPAWRLFWPLVRLMQRRASPEAAAKSSVYLASSEEASRISGAYFESNAKPRRPSEIALDVGNQERAWDLGKTLVGRAPTGEARR